MHWIGKMLAKRGFKDHVDANNITFAETYHGKVVPLKAAEQLVTVDKEIRLIDLEHVIPYNVAKDIILQNPDHIVVLNCPCRIVRPNPCKPVDVCLVIGEPMAGFVAEHHPNRSRRISQQEAVGILREEHRRGHVHHAFFKDAMLGRFYAICNCCSCCCGAVQAHRNGTPMLASSGYVASIDRNSCEDCGACIDSCLFGAISMNGNSPKIDAETCMGCGICVSRCEKGAIKLARKPDKSMPLELDKLLASVASKEYMMDQDS
jgi:ferredoxin